MRAQLLSDLILSAVSSVCSVSSKLLMHFSDLLPPLSLLHSQGPALLLLPWEPELALS